MRSSIQYYAATEDDDFTRSVKSRSLQVKAKERAQFDTARHLSEALLKGIFSEHDIELCSIVPGNKAMVVFEKESAIDEILLGYEEKNNGTPPPVCQWIVSPSYPSWLKLKIMVPRKENLTLDAEMALKVEGDLDRNKASKVPVRKCNSNNLCDTIALNCDNGKRERGGGSTQKAASTFDVAILNEGDEDINRGLSQPPRDEASEVEVGGLVSVRDVTLDF